MSQEVVLPSTSALAKQADFIGQATAVEQARAVAEVQAAVIVAQQVPRDMERATGEMRDTCGRLAMADRAFYSVPNRGNGPTVHLMRELARIWGNVQYGVHELRRDDEAGFSEVQAFAWDVQTNTRSTRTFVAPHARMKGRERQKLTDLGDIYLSNQNVGARAVRECIASILPMWFTEEAQNNCRSTLEHGEGKPVAERIAEMVKAFETVGIKVDQIEAKIGRKKGSWTATDVAQMGIIYTSITRDGLDKDEEFPPPRVTIAEVGQTPAIESVGVEQPTTLEPTFDAEKPVVAQEISDNEPPAPNAITVAQIRAISTITGKLGKDHDEMLVMVSNIVGREITSRKDLSVTEASYVIEALQAQAKNQVTA